MSLINDALKRANQGSKPPATKTPGGAQMRAAQYNRPSKLPLFVFIVFLGALGGGGWYMWKWYQGKKTLPWVKTEQESTEAVKTEPKTKPETASGGTNEAVAPTNSKKSLVISKATIAAEKPTKAPPKAEPEVKPSRFSFFGSGSKSEGNKGTTAAPAGKFPTLKLQGIFYSANNPSAMINGRNLSPGQQILGARVIKIEPEAVTLDWKGEEHMLELAK
jgi:hypothetical protein